jgi:NTE family protein
VGGASGVGNRGRPRRAIVFSGGGARGAYEAGVARYLVQELPRRLGHPIQLDILCGTSVGAIHACYLAATADGGPERADRLVEFWTSMRLEAVLPLSVRDLLGLPGRLLGLRRTSEAIRRGAAPERIYGVLNTRPLEQLVVRSVPWRGIRRNVAAGRVQAVCVAATQIATGRVVAFIEGGDVNESRWRRDPNVIPRQVHLRPTHALASAAIPVLFPAVRVDRTYYADGGLRLNTPLAPALRLGADRVLVVALRRSGHEVHEDALARHRVEDYASPVFLFGKVLNALLLDPVDADLARMHLTNEILEDGESVYGEDFLPRLNAAARRGRRNPFKKIEDVVIRPSVDLGLLAGQVLENSDAASLRSPLLRIAARTRRGEGSAAEADLLSYLLFDRAFVRPLAELGFRDAHAQEEALCRFFSDEAP